MMILAPLSTAPSVGRAACNDVIVIDDDDDEDDKDETGNNPDSVSLTSDIRRDSLLSVDKGVVAIPTGCQCDFCQVSDVISGTMTVTCCGKSSPSTGNWTPPTRKKAVSTSAADSQQPEVIVVDDDVSDDDRGDYDDVDPEVLEFYGITSYVKLTTTTSPMNVTFFAADTKDVAMETSSFADRAPSSRAEPVVIAPANSSIPNGDPEPTCPAGSNDVITCKSDRDEAAADSKTARKFQCKFCSKPFDSKFLCRLHALLNHGNADGDVMVNCSETESETTDSKDIVMSSSPEAEAITRDMDAVNDVGDERNRTNIEKGDHVTPVTNQPTVGDQPEAGNVVEVPMKQKPVEIPHHDCGDYRQNKDHVVKSVENGNQVMTSSNDRFLQSPTVNTTAEVVEASLVATSSSVESSATVDVKPEPMDVLAPTVYSSLFTTGSCNGDESGRQNDEDEDIGSIDNFKYRTKCNYCGKRFTKPGVLQWHMVWHMSGRKRLHCRHCAKMFMNAGSLSRHLALVHKMSIPVGRVINVGAAQVAAPGGGGYECKVCGKVCLKKSALASHTMKHMPRDYACDACGKRFLRPETLARHVITFHAVVTSQQQTRPLYSPPITEQLTELLQVEPLPALEGNYRDTASLLESIVETTAPEPLAAILTPFVVQTEMSTGCDVIQREPAVVDMQTTSDYAWQCAECYRAFRTCNGLDVHMRKHYRQRKYHCVHCGRSFKYRLFSHRCVKTSPPLATTTTAGPRPLSSDVTSSEAPSPSQFAPQSSGHPEKQQNTQQFPPNVEKIELAEARQSLSQVQSNYCSSSSNNNINVSSNSSSSAAIMNGTFTVNHRQSNANLPAGSRRNTQPELDVSSAQRLRLQQQQHLLQLFQQQQEHQRLMESKSLRSPTDRNGGGGITIKTPDSSNSDRQYSQPRVDRHEINRLEQSVPRRQQQQPQFNYHRHNSAVNESSADVAAGRHFTACNQWPEGTRRVNGQPPPPAAAAAATLHAEHSKSFERIQTDPQQQQQQQQQRPHREGHGRSGAGEIYHERRKQPSGTGYSEGHVRQAYWPREMKTHLLCNRDDQRFIDTLQTVVDNISRVAADRCRDMFSGGNCYQRRP